MNKQTKINLKLIFISFFLAFILSACCGTPKAPKRINNICEIFYEKEDWYEHALNSYKKWQIPIPVMMAIIHQESKFKADIKPPRTTCLCIFPGPRPSSAHGYSQALDSTWHAYRKHSGNSGGDREDFEDAVDFVGWYCHNSHKKCGIAKNDAYALYLAYHEGQGGYNRRTYKKKKWLVKVANKVRNRARMYKSQLSKCEHKFKKKNSCCLWPF